VKSRLLALTLGLGLLALPLAPPAAASSIDGANPTEAIVFVSEADLPALLTSGYLGEYAITTAGELGLDPDALLGPGLFGEDAILTPAQLGIDAPQFGFWWKPFFGGFTPVSFVAPVFTFRTFAVPVFRPAFTRFSFPLFGSCCSPFGFTRVVVVIR
jgi:hypothetical protein